VPKFPLVGPSYTSQSVNADCQSTINLYPERIESGEGNANIVLYPSPGTKVFVDLPAPPLPPSAFREPSVFNTIQIPFTGSESGNTLTTSFVPGGGIDPTHGDLQFGDIAIMSFEQNMNPNPNTVASVVMSYLGNSIGTFFQIGPTLNIGGPTGKALGLFYCQIQIPVSRAGTINVAINYSGLIQNANAFMRWTTIRNLTTIDQVSSAVILAPPVFAGTPITISQVEMVLGYIITYLGNSTGTTAQSPLVFFTPPGYGGATIQDPMTFSYKCLPGTYTPTWNAIGPAYTATTAAIVCYSFKLALA